MTKEELLDFLVKNTIYLRESYFKKKFIDDYNEICTWEFPDNYSFSRKLYHYLKNDVSLSLSKCPICGGERAFKSVGRGYFEYCSKKCIYTKERSEKCKKTKLERYGDANYNNMKKNQQTCVERYGVAHVSQCDEIKNKIINSRTSHSVEEKENTKKKTQCTWKEKSEKEKKEHINKIKQTKKKRYNDSNYNNRDKAKSTCYEKYGKSSYVNPDKMKQTKYDKYGDCRYVNPQKAKETKKTRYGDENYVNVKKMKETKCKKYNDPNYNNRKKFMDTLHSDEYVKKQTDKYRNILNEYKSRNIKLCGGVSKLEIDTYDFLVSLFGFDDVLAQYSSNEYPFRCDFYVKSIDTYIELQGYWTHGGHAFDEDNKKDIEKLNYWEKQSAKHKMYDTAIKVWTINDVHKREIAKKNKLNYIEIFETNIEKVKQHILKIQ